MLKSSVKSRVVKNQELMKGNENYDKSIIHLPRHSSFTIMQGFAKWGNTGQNEAENRINTTV